MSRSAISDYVDAVSETLIRTLGSSIKMLEEPASPPDPDRALKLLASVAETLAGFALGAAVGVVANAVRKQFPTAVSTAVDQVVEEARTRLRTARPDPTRRSLMRPLLVDRDARPLLDELGALVHLRLAYAAAAVRDMVTTIGCVIERIAPDQVRWFTSLLTVLATDDLVALRFTHELERGWQAYRAALANEDQHHQGPWRLWSSRVRGELPGRDVLAPDGCLVQIH